MDEDSEPNPSKRARTQLDTYQEIALLNCTGVDKMRCGNIDDAQHFFVKALDYCIAELHQKTDAKIAISDTCRNYVSTSPMEVQQPSRETQYRIQVPSHKDRRQYDEGVNPYPETIEFSETVNVAMQSATLYYNVAQTFMQSLDYVQAVAWFKLAMICLQGAPIDQRVTTTSICAYHNLGVACYQLGHVSDALYCFEKALIYAQGTSSNKVLAANETNAIAVILFHTPTESNTRSLQLFHECVEVFEEAYGVTSKEVAAVYNNIGRAFYADGDMETALVACEKALAIRKQVLDEASIDIAATTCSIGQTLQRLNCLERAELYYSTFLAMAKSNSYNDRDIAIISKNLAEIHHKNGKLIEAMELYKTALTVGRNVFGLLHPEIASTLNRLGNLYYDMKNMRQALSCYTEGLEIEELVLPPFHPRTIITLMNVAEIHYNLDDFKAALEKYKKVYCMQLKRHGPGSLEVAKALSAMGEMEYKMKNNDAAIALFQEVLLIQRVYFHEVEGLEMASTLNSIGIVLFGQGEFDRAQECFQHSLDIQKRELGDDHKDCATLWYNLATTYEEQGDDETANIERSILTPGKREDIVDTLQRLGWLHQRGGNLNEAIEYFEQAMGVLRKNGEKDTVVIGKFLNLIGNNYLQQAKVHKMMECYTEASRIYNAQSVKSHDPNDVLVIKGYCMYGLSKLHPPCAAVA